jgi:GTP-binding protein
MTESVEKVSRSPRSSLHDKVAAAAQGRSVVALVGRANAGKSTLFNRIAPRARAITSAIAGTTRDLNFGRVSHEGREFMLVDSGGLELGGRERITQRVAAEAMAALRSADVVVFVVDGRAGLGASDREVFEMVRRSGRPTIVAVNKIDTAAARNQAADFYSLGAERVCPISSAHGIGIEELLDEIAAKLPLGESAASAPDLRLALIGRPNVGKSSLLNRLVGFDRSLVDVEGGTTRDPVDTELSCGGRKLLLIDTAGIRRPRRVAGELEEHAVGRAIETIRRTEVVILVIDATAGVTDQDARLVRLVDNESRALVVVCNKWDAASQAGAKISAFASDAQERSPYLEFAPMLFTSALTGFGVDKIIPEAIRVGDAYRSQFLTSRLNQILAEATKAMDPPVVDRRRLNLMYVTQVSSAPPRLAFFSNLERGIPAHYERFLDRRFRASLKLEGTPLRMEFRKARPAVGSSRRT